MTTFNYNNVDYTVTDNGYYYKTVNGKKTRISLKAFEAARNAAIAESEAKMDEAMNRKVEEAQSKKEAMERSMDRMDNKVDAITQEDLDNAAEDPNVSLDEFCDMLAEAELAQAIAEYEESCIDEEKAEILKELEEEADRQTEATFNGTAKEDTPKEAKPKKARKPRKSKDIAFSYSPNGTDVITLTAKQVDFIKHIPDTCFYENGLDSTPWCDVLADEIGGQFAGKPMTVGAMISTLREKGLIYVGTDRINNRKCKYFGFTDMGKQVATELGLN